MGQLIDEEDCEVCVPFDQEWIFTYGDLVTLLLCFFILLFATCVYETRKFKAVAESFKPLPPGSPFMQEGRDSVVEQISKEVEQTELGDDTRVTIEEKGVVVSFAASATFEPGSTKLTPEATKEIARFSRLSSSCPTAFRSKATPTTNPCRSSGDPLGNSPEPEPRGWPASSLTTAWIPKSSPSRVSVPPVPSSTMTPPRNADATIASKSLSYHRCKNKLPAVQAPELTTYTTIIR